jgi:hypothetical protein
VISNRRWWLIGGSAVWALAIVAVAVLSYQRDRPTVADQRTLAQALPGVDRATGALLAAIGPERVFAVGPMVITAGCAVTPVRDGGEATRDLTVYVPTGQAPAVLDAIGAALPAGYQADVSHRRGGTAHSLQADAGDFIEVRGAVAGGVITLRALTGCRPLDGPVPTVVPAPAATRPPAALTRALAALDLSGSGAAETRQVACPGGGTARTVAVDGIPAPADLGAALDAVTPTATVVEAGPARYAYRTGDVSVVASVADGRVHVTASTGC